MLNGSRRLSKTIVKRRQTRPQKQDAQRDYFVHLESPSFSSADYVDSKVRPLLYLSGACSQLGDSADWLEKMLFPQRQQFVLQTIYRTISSMPVEVLLQLLPASCLSISKTL
jgi:hypothetical protein